MSRIKYYNGKLDASIFEHLKDIEIELSEWDGENDELREYKSQHGDCMVPRREEFK